MVFGYRSSEGPQQEWSRRVALMAIFSLLDRNQDGFLSLAEYNRFNQAPLSTHRADFHTSCAM